MSAESMIINVVDSDGQWLRRVGSISAPTLCTVISLARSGCPAAPVASGSDPPGT